MKTMTRTALASIAAAVLLSPVAWAADVTPATGAKSAQTETTTPKPKRTRAPSEMSREQYIDHARDLAGKRFDAMDANHDGKLTSAERRAYSKKMREAREKRREERMNKAPSGKGTSK
jgi:hypothetical protein